MCGTRGCRPCVLARSKPRPTSVAAAAVHVVQRTMCRCNVRMPQHAKVRSAGMEGASGCAQADALPLRAAHSPAQQEPVDHQEQQGSQYSVGTGPMSAVEQQVSLRAVQGADAARLPA